MDNVRRRLTIFWVLFLVYFVVALVIDASPLEAWQAHTSITHSLIQSIAAVLAFFCGTAGLYRFYNETQLNGMFLFLGVGFIATGVVDAYHTVVTTAWFKSFFPDVPHSVPEWSWLATRLFLSLLFVLSLCFQNQIKTNQLKPRTVYISVLILTILVLVGFVLIRVPYIIFPDQILARPLELIPGALFIAALIGYFKQSWQTEKIPFWLILALVTSIACQFFYIGLSKHGHDFLYISAHILKIVSYAMVYVAISE